MSLCHDLGVWWSKKTCYTQLLSSCKRSTVNPPMPPAAALSLFVIPNKSQSLFSHSQVIINLLQHGKDHTNYFQLFHKWSATNIWCVCVGKQACTSRSQATYILSVNMGCFAENNFPNCWYQQAWNQNGLFHLVSVSSQYITSYRKRKKNLSGM